MTETREPQMGLTFEQVWAAIIESSRKMEESRQETEREIKDLTESIKQLRESQKETTQQIKETDRLVKETAEQMKETDRLVKETTEQMKETDQRIDALYISMGNVTNRLGELIEHQVLPNISAKFNYFGYHFGEPDTNYEVYDANHALKTELDIVLESKECCIAIEVKLKPNKRDIRDHIKRLDYFRNDKNRQGSVQTIHGAIAGAIMPDGIKCAALEAGLYVIKLEPSGDAIKIEKPEHVYCV
ncbi:MAG: hypothetical protein LBL76_02505 [Treponema sp.]|jgi:hypothetical protein|nr:hypothetical protein [Treponema sp.]